MPFKIYEHQNCPRPKPRRYLSKAVRFQTAFERAKNYSAKKGSLDYYNNGGSIYIEIEDDEGDNYFMDGTGSGFAKSKQSNKGLFFDKHPRYKFDPKKREESQ